MVKGINYKLLVIHY